MVTVVFNAMLNTNDELGKAQPDIQRKPMPASLAKVVA